MSKILHIPEQLAEVLQTQADAKHVKFSTHALSLLGDGLINKKPSTKAKKVLDPKDDPNSPEYEEF